MTTGEAAVTTRPAARHAVRQTPKRGGVYVGRLLAILAAAAALYSFALVPVVASLRGVAAQGTRRAQLARQVKQAALKDKALAAKLTRSERSLTSDTAQETSLQSELAALKQQTPPPAPKVQSFGSISVPTVQATTGASGLP